MTQSTNTLTENVVMTGIAAAVVRAGGRRALAEHLGVTPQAVAVWLEQGYAPDKHVAAINALTGVPNAKLLDPATVALLAKKP